MRAACSPVPHGARGRRCSGRGRRCSPTRCRCTAISHSSRRRSDLGAAAPAAWIRWRAHCAPRPRRPVRCVPVSMPRPHWRVSRARMRRAQTRVGAASAFASSVHAALSRRARALRDRAAGHLAGARASLAAADAASRDAYEVVDRVGRRTHPIAGSRCARAAAAATCAYTMLTCLCAVSRYYGVNAAVFHARHIASGTAVALKLMCVARALLRTCTALLTHVMSGRAGTRRAALTRRHCASGARVRALE